MNQMVPFRCPVCGERLLRNASVWHCERGHSFDIARQGYVNLLMSNQPAARRHGDDKVMVRARQAFLERGYYDCLRDRICEIAVDSCDQEVFLLDAGCGEGWYTAAVRRALSQSGRSCLACGIDISKTALIQAAKRDPELSLAVGSVRSLPIETGSVDLLLSIFAPVNEDEFFRVLKPGAIMICAMPLQEHLLGLKEAVYDSPYRNPEPVFTPAGFSLMRQEEIRDRILLRSRSDIQNLFMMTPYYYKTGKADQEKLEAYDTLETEIGFCVFAFRRN